MAKKFRLTLEPITPKKPVCFYGGLEGLVGININGIEVLGNIEGIQVKEPIGYTIDWLLRNFEKYTSLEIPKEVIPAIHLYDELNQSYSELLKKSSLDWLSSHAFGYPYLKFPIVFQRRKNKIEISWDILKSFFINPIGCEYISLDSFKEGVLNSINISLKKIKSMGKVYDYNQHEAELRSLYKQARSN